MGDLQTVTVYPPPVFMFPKGLKMYMAKDIWTFKGYLSKFTPIGMNVADGEPIAAITITPREDES